MEVARNAKAMNLPTRFLAICLTALATATEAQDLSADFMAAVRDLMAQVRADEVIE
jgi:hypothetical protein